MIIQRIIIFWGLMMVLLTTCTSLKDISSKPEYIESKDELNQLYSKTPLTRKVLNTEFGDVYYWISGTGEETIAFTHGATADHNLFIYQVDFFSKDFTVITWDVPSHGLSRPFDDFSLLKSVDILKKILKQENIQKVHLVGQSMGGYISTMFSVINPDLTLSLTMVGSSPMTPEYFSGWDKWMLSITPTILSCYGDEALIIDIAENVSVTSLGKVYMYEVLKKQTKQEISTIMESVYKGILDFAALNKKVICPVLIVYGENEKTGKVVEYSKKWAEEEGHPLITIPNAAHNTNMDNPYFFNRALKQYLSGL